MTKLRQEIEIDTEKYVNLLVSGKLYEFEESLHAYVLQEVYDKLAKSLIETSLLDGRMSERLGILCQNKRMGKIQPREASLQLRTGSYIKITTGYAKQVPAKLSGSRYALFQYWGVIKNASPSFYSQVSKFSVLCSSFDIATEIFKGLGYHIHTERMRSLTLSVAQEGLSQRVPSMLGVSDSLAGKRVV